MWSFFKMQYKWAVMEVPAGYHSCLEVLLMRVEFILYNMGTMLFALPRRARIFIHSAAVFLLPCSCKIQCIHGFQDYIHPNS